MKLDEKYLIKVRVIERKVEDYFNNLLLKYFNLLNSYNIKVEGRTKNLVMMVTFDFLIVAFFNSLSYVDINFARFFVHDSLQNFYVKNFKKEYPCEKYLEFNNDFINLFFLIYCLPQIMFIKKQAIFKEIKIASKNIKRKRFNNLFFYFIKIFLLLVDGFNLDSIDVEFMETAKIGVFNDSEISSVIKTMYNELLTIFVYFKDLKKEVKLIK